MLVSLARDGLMIGLHSFHFLWLGMGVLVPNLARSIPPLMEDRFL